LQRSTAQFDHKLWPHLRAAYNLARWITRNDHDAEDVVQESFMKALGAFDRTPIADPKSWILRIVRNTAITHLGRRRGPKMFTLDDAPAVRDPAPDPERRFAESSRRSQLRSAIERLPSEFRDTLVLRDIENLSYKEIAAVLQVPIGTVMSRLSRARTILLQELAPEKGATA
jgi:RNA polymerase sigma-70 factor (ECF subfamily)